MSSFVYFKFKSQKEPQRVTIDGPHTDVWNLKREIITISRLGDGTDFDLKIYKENSDEEYTDDTEIIPKDSTVLARRLPAAAPGKGRAARYVSGKPPASAKPSSMASKATKAIDMDGAMTEEERLKAMLKMTDAQWQREKEEMSHEQRILSSGGKQFQNKANIPEGEPPHTYTCFRCRKRGHWIQACPTNGDVNYDSRHRIKRTTGIPRSMLKKVDESEIDQLDEAQLHNLMVDADGDYVLTQADEKAWRKHQEQVRAAEAAKKNAQSGNQDLQERGLECQIDKRLFVDPMKTPCCGKTYCHDCIENALLESDLTCPGCETENVSLERLEPDEDMKMKIKEYENDKTKAKSPVASVAGTPKAEESDKDSRPATRDGSQSPASTGSTAGKKRTASEANDSKPDTLAPPVMKRQKSGESTVATTQADVQSWPTNNMPMNMMPPDMSSMMPNMPMNFPMMPFTMPNMMGMNGMNGMNMMPNMNFMPPNFSNMNMMNGMFPQGNNGNFNSIANGTFNNNNNNSNQNSGYGYNNNNNNRTGNFQYRGRGGAGHQKPFNSHQQQQQNQAPAGLSGVPTGPKAMQSQAAPHQNKFSNQQRPTGNEEDNAYMRQPVNPNRVRNHGGGRMRQADYREL